MVRANLTDSSCKCSLCARFFICYDNETHASKKMISFNNSRCYFYLDKDSDGSRRMS